MTMHMFKAIYSVPPDLKPHQYSGLLGTVPGAGGQGPGARGCTGNSMTEECWSIRVQRDRKAERNKKQESPGTLQAGKGQLTGPYIMTLTTFFLFV